MVKLILELLGVSDTPPDSVSQFSVQTIITHGTPTALHTPPLNGEQHIYKMGAPVMIVSPS
jgi:hypothetical protein